MNQRLCLTNASACTLSKKREFMLVLYFPAIYSTSPFGRIARCGGESCLILMCALPLSLRPLRCCVTCCWCTAPARCAPSPPSTRWPCRPPTPCAQRWPPTSSTSSSRTTLRTTPPTVDHPQSNRTAAAESTPLGLGFSLGNKYYVLFK